MSEQQQLEEQEPSVPVYTRAEVAAHNRRKDLWMVIDNDVYDLTNFLERHPGGTAPLKYAGDDATHVFHKVHKSSTLRKYDKVLKIGTLAEADRMDTSAREKHTYASEVGSISDDEDGYDERPHDAEDREFGDLMAAEGETSNIHALILLVYAFMAGYAALTSYVTGCHILTVPGFYLAGMIAFYLWHQLAHSQTFSSFMQRVGLGYFAEMYEMHMVHHLIHFPPKRFYGTAKLNKEMYPDGRPNLWNLMDITKTTNIASGTKAEKTFGQKSHSPLAHEWPLILEMVLILVGGYWFIPGCSLLTILFVFGLYTAVALVGNGLHMSFHVRHFHLEKYAWYRELRTLHYIHHLGDMKKGLCMWNLGFEG